MIDIKNAGYRFNSIEDLAENNTFIHNLNSQTKIITTFLYVVIVVSFNKYDLTGLTLFILYPVIMISLAKIPFKYFYWRVAIAIPFCFFAGIANLIYDNETAFKLLNLTITFGMISFITLIVKCLLTISSVLVLIATTTLSEIARQLIKYKVPSNFVLLIALVYRYIDVILKESANMYLAYLLRSQEQKGVKMKDMGIFLGQLILKSLDRAERVYCAMKCRGFNGEFSYRITKPVPITEKLYIITFLLLMLLLRIIF